MKAWNLYSSATREGQKSSIKSEGKSSIPTKSWQPFQFTCCRIDLCKIAKVHDL